MALTTTSTSVGTTAVAIVTGLVADLPASSSLVISNLGTNPVFIGPPGVTATTGIQIAAGANLTLHAFGRSDLWAISGTGSNTVNTCVFQ